MEAKTRLSYLMSEHLLRTQVSLNICIIPNTAYPRVLHDSHTRVQAAAWKWFGRERESLSQSTHISFWEHSSHFRLIGRGVPGGVFLFLVSVQYFLLGLPQGRNPRSPYERPGARRCTCQATKQPMHSLLLTNTAIAVG